MHKGQSTIELAAIAVLVITGIIVGGPYVLRSIQAHFKLWSHSVQESTDDHLIEPQDVNIDLPPCTFTWVPGSCGASGCKKTERVYSKNSTPAGCDFGLKCEVDPACCTEPVRSNSVCWRSPASAPQPATDGIPAGFHVCGSGTPLDNVRDRVFQFNCGALQNVQVCQQDTTDGDGDRDCTPQCRRGITNATTCPGDGTELLDDVDITLVGLLAECSTVNPEQKCEGYCEPAHRPEGNMCVPTCGSDPGAGPGDAGVCQPQFGENCATCAADCPCGTNTKCDLPTATCVNTCGVDGCQNEFGEDQNTCCVDCACPTGQMCDTTNAATGTCIATCGAPGHEFCEPQFGEDCNTCATDCNCGSFTGCSCTGMQLCGTNTGKCESSCGDGQCNNLNNGENQTTCCQDCGCPGNQTCDPLSQTCVVAPIQCIVRSAIGSDQVYSPSCLPGEIATGGGVRERDFPNDRNANWDCPSNNSGQCISGTGATRWRCFGEDDNIECYAVCCPSSLPVQQCVVRAVVGGEETQANCNPGEVLTGGGMHSNGNGNFAYPVNDGSWTPQGWQNQASDGQTPVGWHCYGENDNTICFAVCCAPLTGSNLQCTVRRNPVVNYGGEIVDSQNCAPGQFLTGGGTIEHFDQNSNAAYPNASNGGTAKSWHCWGAGDDVACYGICCGTSN
ncbi:MAG: hypothetical protein HY591_04810 [Candidatus Omnitrophica bacterium]|nr:hypothetical protein [Candidatus Omnitrophota bacterium]